MSARGDKRVAVLARIRSALGSLSFSWLGPVGQFVLWLLPLVPLVHGRRGRNASALLVVAALMTNVWFPELYRDYVNHLTPGSIAFLLARNALLVGVLVVLLQPERDMQEALSPGARSPGGRTASRRA